MHFLQKLMHGPLKTNTLTPAFVLNSHSLVTTVVLTCFLLFFGLLGTEGNPPPELIEVLFSSPAVLGVEVGS